MISRAGRAAASAAFAGMWLLSLTATAAAARPGYENVPNSGGENGFPGRGTLPFTGSNVTMVVALGCVVLVIGLALARASRDPS